MKHNTAVQALTAQNEELKRQLAAAIEQNTALKDHSESLEDDLTSLLSKNEVMKVSAKEHMKAIQAREEGSQEDLELWKAMGIYNED